MCEERTSLRHSPQRQLWGYECGELQMRGVLQENMEQLARERISDDVLSTRDVPDVEVNPGRDKHLGSAAQNDVVAFESLKRMENLHRIHAVCEDGDVAWPVRQRGSPEQCEEDGEAFIPENAAC